VQTYLRIWDASSPYHPEPADADIAVQQKSV